MSKALILNDKINFNLIGNFGNAEWLYTQNLINYKIAIDWMNNHVINIQKNISKDTVWLLEHESIYTGGTSAKKNELINSELIKVSRSGRGGQWTWHGPGQRIVYIMLNLNYRKKDVRWYVSKLEQCIIDTLEAFSIKGERRQNLPGVWVDKRINNKKFNINKIAAIGIRISRWVTYHGISININPSLSEYKGIVPCGIQDAGVTSLYELGVNISMGKFDKILIQNFNKLFEVN